MVQITKRDGVLYYGETPCEDENDAYDWFHDEYNERMGKTYEFGFYRRLEDQLEKEPCFGHRKVKYRLMGLVGIHYCRIFGMWDYPKLTDEQFERWFEWALTQGNNAVTMVERKSEAGRTSKNLRKRYR